MTDWRLVVPLLALTLMLPLLMLGATVVVAPVADAAAGGSTLLPVALLLCGFLPAGFCLVSASESFVGEKERNTLEALLATPMTDGELYLGKLVAAFIPPALSSAVAMATYLGLAALLAPGAEAAWGTLAVVVAAVMGKALVMTTAALLVSIRATTIRAANLLASFILAPMAVLVEVETLLLVWGYATALFALAPALFAVVALLACIGLTAFNRETILGREHRGLSLRRRERGAGLQKP